MNKTLLFAVCLGLMAGLTTVSRAADADKKADKAAHHAEMLKKYDKNGDGKLDEQEKAAMKEDLKKHKKEAKHADKK